MQTAQYSDRVQQLLAQLDANENGLSQKNRSLSEQLLAEAQSRSDPALTGAAWFYMGCCAYASSELSRSMEYLTRALPFLQHSGDWGRLGRCYNLLGLLMDYQDDLVGSIECFYSGIACMREHHLDEKTAILCFNLSLIFEESDDWDSALEYRVTALQELEKARDSTRYGELRLLGESMLLRLYLRMGRETDVRSQMALLETLLDRFPEERGRLNVLVYEAEYAFRYGSPARAQELLTQSLRAFDASDDFLSGCDDCLALARCLAEHGRFGEAMRVLDRTAQELADISEADVQLQYQLQVCRIECCRMWGEAGRDREIEALNAYYALSRNRGRNYRQTRRRLLDLRHVLDETRSENERLARSAETDPLTGLPNRRKLQEMQDTWFEHAQSRQLSLGVAMLDIDHFKALNDAGGHAGGDEGLRLVASVLRAQAGEKAFAARYGGDEFMLLYYDMTDEEILAQLRRIRSDIAAGSAALACGRFTASIGVRNSVPRPDNHVWDYTAAADAALYKIKRCGRDDLLLVHSTKDVPAKSWMNGPGAAGTTI